MDELLAFKAYDETTIDDIANTVLERKRKKRQIEIPRNLTDIEIDDIVNSIPAMVAPDRKVSSTVMESLKSFMRQLLKQPDMKIIESAITNNILKDEIISRYRFSKVDPGKSVGLSAAEAIGAQLMQATLNTFHKSGSAKNVASGFKAYDQFLKITKNPSFPSCDIYFNDSPSYEDIIRHKRASIVSLSVKQITKLYTVETYNLKEIKNMKWYNTYYLIEKNRFGWEDIKNMYKEMEESNFYLRLEIDTNIAYAHKVLIGDIVRTINNNDMGSNSTIICIPSPFMNKDGNTKGYIDIFPRYIQAENILTKNNKKNKIKFKPKQTNISQLYINMIIIPQLDNWNIKGVENITEIYPEEYPVWSIVSREVRNPNNAEQFILTLDKMKMKYSGITKQNIITLWKEVLDLMDIETSKKFSKLKQSSVGTDTSEFIIVYIPNRPKDLSNVIKNKSIIKWIPSQVINYLTNKELNDQIDYKKQKVKDRNMLISEGEEKKALDIRLLLPRSKLQKKLSFVYAGSNGSNLIKLIELEDIDENRTVSNIPREMIKIFGVEATRNHMAYTLYNIIIAEDNYVNPRHITLISDHMTRLGFLLPINETGMKYQPIGTLGRAGFKKAKDQFKPALLMGKMEGADAVHTSIMVGKKIRQGTGLPEFKVNKDRQIKLLKLLKLKNISGPKFEQQFDEAHNIDSEDNNDNYIDDYFVSEGNERIVTYGNANNIPEPVQYSADQVGGLESVVSQTYGTDVKPEIEYMSNQIYIKQYPNFEQFITNVPKYNISLLDKFIFV